MRRCVIILWDGVSYRSLVARLDLLPCIRHLAETGSLLKGKATLVTTTGPAHIPFLYGVDAGEADIPGIRWYDRRNSQARTYMGIGFWKMIADIRPQLVPLSSFFRKPYAIFSTLASSSSFVKLSVFCFYSLGRLGTAWNLVDSAGGSMLRWVLKRGADFVFAVFPGVDELSHCYGIDSLRVDAEYMYLDSLLCDLLDMEDISLWVVSDHGLTDTHTHIPLVGMAKQLNLRVLYYPVAWNYNADIAIMESGNACAMLYYLSQTSDVKDRVRELLSQLMEHEGILGIFERERRAFLYLRRKTSYSGAVNSLAKSERTGDFIVFADKGYDLRSRYELPLHRASHGSILEEHIEVPVVTNIKLKTESCSVRDIMPTILQQFGYKRPLTCKGRVLC